MGHSIDAQKAGEIIWTHWQNGTVFEVLPEGAQPASRAEGYAIQALLERRTAKPLVGWKIAATSTAGQSHIGVDGPLAGRILAERTFGPGAVLKIAPNRMRVAEPEFAFRAGRDIFPRVAPYGVDETLEAMDALHVAIEIPDSRFADFAHVGAAHLIADNACAHEFVLGKATSANWRTLDLSHYPVHARIPGKLERDGIGSNVLGDPRVALTWLVNELSGLGIALRKGEIVTTGTCMVPIPIVAGDEVQADFGVLGQISVAFA